MSYVGLPPAAQVLMWAYDRVSGSDAERIEKAERIGAWLLSWKSPQPDRVLGAPISPQYHMPGGPWLPVIDPPRQSGQIVDPHVVPASHDLAKPVPNLPQAIPGVRHGIAMHELPRDPSPAIDSAELQRAIDAHKALGNPRNASVSASAPDSIAKFFESLKNETQTKLADLANKIATIADSPPRSGAAAAGGDAASSAAMPASLVGAELPRALTDWELKAKANNQTIVARNP